MADLICRNIRSLVYSRNEILCENKSLEHEIEVLKCELPSIQLDLEELTTERNNLRKDLKQLAEEKDTYVEEAKRREEMYNHRQAEVKKLLHDNECLQFRYKALEDDTELYRQDIGVLEKYLIGIKKKSDDMDLTAEELIYENKESDSKVNYLKSKVSQMKKCLRELSEDLEDKCNELDHVFQNLRNCENVRDHLESKGTEIRRQVLELQTKLCHCQSKIQSERVCNEKLQDKVIEAKNLSECIKENIEKYLREREKIQQRKDYHLNEILNVINEVKDDVTTQRPHRKPVSENGPERKSRHKFHKSRSYSMDCTKDAESDGRLVSSRGKRPEEFHQAGDAGVARRKTMVDMIFENIAEAKTSSELDNNIQKMRREVENDRQMEHAEEGKRHPHTRQRTMCMVEQFLTKAQECRNCDNIEFDRPRSKFEKHRNNMHEPKVKGDFEFRPKTMVDKTRDGKHSNKINGECDPRPRTIDITIRSTADGLHKSSKRHDAASKPKITVNKMQDSRNSSRRKQKLVDEILRELLFSDLDDSASMAQDLRAIKQSKCRYKK